MRLRLSFPVISLKDSPHKPLSRRPQISFYSVWDTSARSVNPRFHGKLDICCLCFRNWMCEIHARNFKDVGSERLVLLEVPCNNARAKRVRIVFCHRVWRDQPRGKTKGGAAPEVDPDTRGRENTISSSESECIVIAL